METRPRARPGQLHFVPYFLAAAVFAAAFTSAAQAGEPDPSAELRRLREALDTERQARRADREEFERRLQALEKAPSAATAPLPPVPPEPTAHPDAPLAPSAAGAPSAPPALTREDITAVVEDYMTERDLFASLPENQTIPNAGTLLDISVVLDATVGTSTAGDDALSGAIALGDHDPHVRGFNARNEEFVMSADVDPWFFGFFDVVYKLSEEGESEFELEEAYALTTSLPWNLQLKVGQFFTEFGRLNPTHPHTWQFVNYPVILGRVFGSDGWRGQGARLSWIVPHTCFPLTLLGGVQNARGETQEPFYGEEGAVVGNHVYAYDEVHAFDDLAWYARAETSRDFPHVHCGTLSALGGLDVAFGPNGTGKGGHTRLYGADLFLKWRADKSDAGWPWAQWQTEFLRRDLDAADQDLEIDDGMGGSMPFHVDSFAYHDTGFYSELVWGFQRPWSIGVRYDQAWSNGIYAGGYTRVSAALTYYPSEFSRIRLELNYDHVPGLSDEYPSEEDDNLSVWLNFNFSLGKHGAHKF